MEADLDQFAQDLPDLIEIIDDNNNNIMSVPDSSSNAKPNGSAPVISSKDAKNNPKGEGKGGKESGDASIQDKQVQIVGGEPKVIRLVPLQLCAARIESLIKVGFDFFTNQYLSSVEMPPPFTF